MSSAPLQVSRMVELEIDGAPVKVFEGETILDAITKAGIETPTLCFGETLQPKNAVKFDKSAATFSVSTGDPTDSVRWQRSLDLGTTWSEITGATSATYTIPSVTASTGGESTGYRH